jgi:hypothetical protein
MKRKPSDYGLKTSCSTRRYDKATGRYVPSCNEPQTPEKGWLDELEVRFVMKCDEIGEPAYVRVLAVDSEEIRAFKKEVRAGRVSKADLEHYLKVLKEEVEGELQRKFERNRSVEALERSVRGENSRKARATQTRKLKALSEQERAKADADAKALEARIETLKAELARMKAGKRREVLRNRINRLTGARLQLQKIAAGKAYKWPKASLMR